MIDFESVDRKLNTHFNRVHMVLDKLKSHISMSNGMLGQVMLMLHTQGRHEDAEVIKKTINSSVNIAEELKEALKSIGGDMGEYSDMLKELQSMVDRLL